MGYDIQLFTPIYLRIFYLIRMLTELISIGIRQLIFVYFLPQYYRSVRTNNVNIMIAGEY